MFQNFKIKNLAVVFGIFEKNSMKFTNNLTCIPPKKVCFPIVMNKGLKHKLTKRVPSIQSLIWKG